MSKLRFGALLLLTLALVGVGLPAVAQDDDDAKNFKLNGMLRTRFDNFEDYDLNSNTDDNYNFWAYRAMIGVTGTFTDGVSAHIDLQSYGDLGEFTNTTYNMPGNAFGLGGGNSTDMYQAFVMLDELGGTNWDVSVGRRELTFGKELQFGDNDFYNGQTFDGILAHGEFERWNLGVGFLKINESGFFPTDTDDDEWLLGGKANFKLGEYGSIEPYVIHRRDGQDGALREDLTTFGALWMHQGEDSPWDASAEVALQSGETGVGAGAIDLSGMIFEGEFGWRFGEIHRVYVNGLMASGDDGSDPSDNENYTPLYPDLHAYNRLGNTDSFELTNIQDLSIGYSASFNDDRHKFMAAAHMLTAVEDTGTNPYFGLGGPLVGEDDLGTELDAQYDFQYSDNASFQVGVATLSAGDALGANADDPFRVWGGLLVSWGRQSGDMREDEE